MGADKSQWVRLLDVFVLGPFMIWYALATAGDGVSETGTLVGLPTGSALALLVGGILTIIYNGLNWTRNSNWL